MIEATLFVWKLRNGREEGLVCSYIKCKNYLLKIAYILRLITSLRRKKEMNDG